MEAKRSELRKKFFWLKRQRIFGAQFEIMFSYKTRLDKQNVLKILNQNQPEVNCNENENRIEESVLIALDSLVYEGFCSDAVDVSINSIDSLLPVNNTGLFPRGIALILPSIVSFCKLLLIMVVI